MASAFELQFISPLDVAFRVAGNPKRRRHEELGSQCRQGEDVVWIDGERLFAERECSIRLLADRSDLPLARSALESQVLGVAIGTGRPFEPGSLGLGELKVEFVRQMRDDRVLRLQKLAVGRVELLGP